MEDIQIQNNRHILYLLTSSKHFISSFFSVALGHGWRLGFFGLLHMEVFMQRLEQEYGTCSIVTTPSVTYKAKIFGKKNIKEYKTDMISFNNPAKFPDPNIVEELYEPMVLGSIITPSIFNILLIKFYV